MSRLHHVAYRCRDAQETTNFYANLLGFPLAMSLVAETVPSIKKLDPHIHIFFRMGDGSFIAFFDTLDGMEPLGSLQDDWAQHLAIHVDDQKAAEAIVARLSAANVEVVGPVDHDICMSYYFRDPNGHRLELAVPTPKAPQIFKAEIDHAQTLVDEWMVRKNAAHVES